MLPYCRIFASSIWRPLRRPSAALGLQPHRALCSALRYIILVNRCLSDTRRFAVLPDHSPATGAAGAVLEIRDARLLGNTQEGTFLVMCRSVGRCTSVRELEVEAGTHGLRYARVAPLEDDDEADAGAARTAEDFLGPDLKQLADRTAAIVVE